MLSYNDDVVPRKESIKRLELPQTPTKPNSVVLIWRAVGGKVYKAECRDYPVRVVLAKRDGFWYAGIYHEAENETVLISRKGRSMESALWTAWDCSEARSSRNYLEIPDSLNWGNMPSGRLYDTETQKYLHEKPEIPPETPDYRAGRAPLHADKQRVVENNQMSALPENRVMNFVGGYAVLPEGFTVTRNTEDAQKRAAKIQTTKEAEVEANIKHWTDEKGRQRTTAYGVESMLVNGAWELI